MKPTIKFESLSDTDAPLSRKLMCTIWQLDERSESQGSDPIVESRPILVGSADPKSGESEISLPSPCNYLVDVGFPNGRRTRRAVSVKEDEPYRFVVQESRYSSSGAHSVQSAQPSFLKDAPRVMMSAARSIFSHSELEIRLSATQSGQKVGSLRALRQFLKQIEGVSSEAVLVNRERVAELSHVVELDSRPARIDTDFENFTHRRAWLLVSGQGKDTTVVPFANGWTSGSGRSAFLLQVHRKETTGEEASKWSVSLQLRDPAYGSLLDFLTRRNFHASSAISKTIQAAAVEALYEKQVNPYAAAAGAYMLAIDDEDAHAQQAIWMGNLTERFPWLPDGPIALGYRLLRRTEKGTEDFVRARELLLEASNRGLPYFTIGLTLLTEALNFLVLANPDDAEAKSHLAAATAAQIACVRSEAFCTLQTSRFYRLPQGPEERV